MKNKCLALVLLGLLPGTSSFVSAATCSCAGVPLSNAINLVGPDAGKFQFGLSLTRSDISDLVSGSNEINDETGRKRETDSYLFETSYGINEDWAITGVLSWIEHTRNIAISNTADENSSGIGDSLVVLSYAPVKIDPFSKNEWAFGLGIRIPTGEDENGSPIIYAEDMQPGQGAWGTSVWFHYGRAFNQKASWVYFFDGNFISNNKNGREYSFENEWNLTTGVQYYSDTKWQANLALSYRDANSHTRFGNDIPNTGGEWLDLSSSINYAITPKTSIGFSFKLPVDRELNGALQFTTKQSVSISVTHQL